MQTGTPLHKDEPDYRGQDRDQHKLAKPTARRAFVFEKVIAFVIRIVAQAKERWALDAVVLTMLRAKHWLSWGAMRVCISNRHFLDGSRISFGVVHVTRRRLIGRLSR
jgi:hypothetical protein